MRRREVGSIAAAVALLVLAACRDDPSVSGGPPATSAAPTGSITEQTEPPMTTPVAPPGLKGASCKTRGAGSYANTPRFVSVGTATESGVERIVFEFEPDPGATEPPAWNVAFTDSLASDGEGAPVEVAGEAFIYVSFGAIGTDLSGEEPVPVYTGPRELDVGGSTLLEAEQLGDFENIISWGLGLSSKACFRATADPNDLTLEFPAA